jgi:hypothetical protein
MKYDVGAASPVRPPAACALQPLGSGQPSHGRGGRHARRLIAPTATAPPPRHGHGSCRAREPASRLVEESTGIAVLTLIRSSGSRISQQSPFRHGSVPIRTRSGPVARSMSRWVCASRYLDDGAAQAHAVAQGATQDKNCPLRSSRARRVFRGSCRSPAGTRKPLTQLQLKRGSIGRSA